MIIGGAPSTPRNTEASRVTGASGSWQLDVDQTNGIVSAVKSDVSGLGTSLESLKALFAEAISALKSTDDVSGAVAKVEAQSEPGAQKIPASSNAVVSSTTDAMAAFVHADESMSATTTALNHQATGGSDSLPGWLKPGVQVPGLVIVRGFSSAGQ